MLYNGRGLFVGTRRKNSDCGFPLFVEVKIVASKTLRTFTLNVSRERTQDCHIKTLNRYDNVQQYHTRRVTSCRAITHST